MEGEGSPAATTDARAAPPPTTAIEGEGSAAATTDAPAAPPPPTSMEGEGSPADTTDAPAARRRRLSVPVSLPVVPDDVVVLDILRRLPAKAVIRFGAVCRSWQAGTTTSQFRRAFHAQKPSLPLIEFREPLTRFYSDALETMDVLARAECRRRVVKFDWRHLRLHASCDGLLLLSFTANGRYLICNPATRQCIPLPGLTGGEIAGMYSSCSAGGDPETAEYRVLFWKGKAGSASYFVLTVGSSAQPRPVVLPGAPQDFAAALLSGVYGRYRPAAFFHHGLHWVPGSYGEGTQEKVVVFDIIKESFRSIRSPVAIASKFETKAAHIFVMEGTLCVNMLKLQGGPDPGSTVTTWALSDYAREIWEVQNVVSLAAKCSDHIVVSNKGDLLVYLDWHVRRLIRTDREGNELREFPMESSSARITGHWYKENLVRHTFFEARRKQPQPPFFNGA